MSKKRQLKIEEVLNADELKLVKKTMTNFLENPDYATGGEEGLTFDTLKFGQPLPMEIVLRDWKTELNEGTGGREYRAGDCFEIYKKLYKGDIEIVN